MILPKSKFWGTKQLNGTHIPNKEIRALLKDSHSERHWELYKRGMILHGPVYAGMCFLALAIVPTDVPSGTWVSLICGGLALSLAGGAMKNRAIEMYNEQFCPANNVRKFYLPLLVREF